ncbi:MAG: 1-phosphofructokinase [Ruminococcus sp.]|nr:1-phosphofructokinase [Ruminococcus sp.]
MIYTVTFNPAIDYVVHTAAMIPGTVNRSSYEEIYYGGKGINVSAVLSELGIRSKALGFIAGFTGEAIEKGVREMGIDTDFVKLPDGNSRINVKIKADTETELNGQGPHITQSDLTALFSRLTKVRSGDTLILAGSIPPSLPNDTYERILRAVSGRFVRTVVDASGDLLLNVLKYKPFIIKPNHIELGELFHKTLSEEKDILAHAKLLCDMGAQNVLVSMAGDGAILLEGDGTVHRCGVCRGTVRNSVGAGDSMLAGFIAGLTEGDFDHALKLGTACGGATAFSDGLAKRYDIYELLKQL